MRYVDSLFVLFSGPRKGHSAKKSTIAQWVRTLITYCSLHSQGQISSCAHSTRSVGVTGAFLQQVTVALLCKAATCSYIHTFSNFYYVDVQSSADAAFGPKVLAAAHWSLVCWPLLLLDLLTPFCLPSCCPPFSLIAWGCPRVYEYFVSSTVQLS